MVLPFPSAVCVWLVQVNQEVQLHQQLTSDCVVPFWAAVDEGAQLHIIMQYCQQSDLRSMLGSGPLSEACVRDQIVIPLLQALQELHTKVGGCTSGTGVWGVGCVTPGQLAPQHRRMQASRCRPSATTLPTSR